MKVKPRVKVKVGIKAGVKMRVKLKVKVESYLNHMMRLVLEPSVMGRAPWRAEPLGWGIF